MRALRFTCAFHVVLAVLDRMAPQTAPNYPLQTTSQFLAGRPRVRTISLPVTFP